jgi:hypothetical protein
MDDPEPLWKRILTDETLWVTIAVVAVLAAAFFLATGG